MKKYRFYEYLGRGGNLPPAQFFIDYRNGIDKFLNDPNTIIIPGFHVQGKKIIKVHLAYNRPRRIVLCANRVSGDLIAGQRVGKPQFQLSVDKGIYLDTPKKIEAVNEHLAQ